MNDVLVPNAKEKKVRISSIFSIIRFSVY